ncbi:hypothetical protein [Bifidobacterium miconisargentati]|uniref:hypothetical protein n=1 Tax=Bifidobacterium miconisargentati TaxID=2834437 RepID=UPI001BDD1350|nr:hypothetical protein [Bifidobacterium miconisargentati]MBW3089834.1 hypothetical protein [Bifidobacterium miconisargentati]
MNIEATLKSLSLEEKARLCSGKSFSNTNDLDGKLPSIELVDGPHGLRKQGGDQDMLGVFGSHPATCFPSGATTANSWDPELMREIGTALGEECRDQGSA